MSRTTHPGAARTVGNVEIRPSELGVLVDERRVGLTVREFELFLVLAERDDRVVRRRAGATSTPTSASATASTRSGRSRGRVRAG